jgi:hypothetical protein
MDSSYFSNVPNLSVSGTERAVTVDSPPLFPGQTQWPQFAAAAHRTWSENLKFDEVFATFVVARNSIAEHRHP